MADERLFSRAGPFEFGAIARLAVGLLDQAGKSGVVDARLIGDRLECLAGRRAPGRRLEAKDRPIDAPGTAGRSDAESRSAQAFRALRGD